MVLYKSRGYVFWLSSMKVICKFKTMEVTRKTSASRKEFGFLMKQSFFLEVFEFSEIDSVPSWHQAACQDTLGKAERCTCPSVHTCRGRRGRKGMHGSDCPHRANEELLGYASSIVSKAGTSILWAINFKNLKLLKQSLSEVSSWFLNKVESVLLFARCWAYYSTICRGFTPTVSLKKMVSGKKAIHYVSLHMLTCNTYFLQILKEILKQFCYPDLNPKHITHVLQKSYITVWHFSRKTKLWRPIWGVSTLLTFIW